MTESLKVFVSDYKKEAKELHIFLEWEDNYFPPHRFVIRKDEIRVEVTENDGGWQDSTTYRGSYLDLIWAADHHVLDFVSLVRILEKILGRKLNF